MTTPDPATGEPLVQMTQEQYEALASQALLNASNPRGLVTMLQEIDKRNLLQRYIAVIRWQELDSPPPGIRYPVSWPPSMTVVLNQAKPISRADADKALGGAARRPANAVITKDPEGKVGWSTFDAFFRTAT